MTLLWVFFCFCCLPHNFALQLFFESIFSFPKTSIADCDSLIDEFYVFRNYHNYNA